MWFIRYLRDLLLELWMGILMLYPAWPKTLTTWKESSLARWMEVFFFSFRVFLKTLCSPFSNFYLEQVVCWTRSFCCLEDECNDTCCCLLCSLLLQFWDYMYWSVLFGIQFSSSESVYFSDRFKVNDNETY